MRKSTALEYVGRFKREFPDIKWTELMAVQEGVTWGLQSRNALTGEMSEVFTEAIYADNMFYRTRQFVDYLAHTHDRR